MFKFRPIYFVSFCLVAIPQIGAAKVFKEIVPGETYEANGGDERDIMDFYPARNADITVTLTPKSVTSSVVILYNQKQVEIERAIMSDAPVTLHVPPNINYAFLRVVPVGGRYDPVAGEHFTRSAANATADTKVLGPYSIRMTARMSGKNGDTEREIVRTGGMFGITYRAKPKEVPSATPVSVSAAVSDPVESRKVDVAAELNNLPSGPRMALIVGNGVYGGALGSLANAVNDAHSIAAALRRSGFEVIEVVNADQKTMKRAILTFGQRLSAAGRSATGLFYYAGHGVQSRGVNFLVPVGAAIETEADVDLEAVAADTVLRQMEEAGASTNIVILDACRNLPVKRVYRDGARGLARMDAPNGSYVAYSTAPGSVAADGSGANSPFATALIAEMAKPGQPIEAMFRNVRRSVLKATDGKQTPWDSSSLLESFTFTPGK
ncbi:caspase family protein [Sphingobium xenophagum]|uniref:Carboxyl-terminal processing protease n=1 Tax=Sphingobium xenophagum TaxID=121428 RepID=A0A401J0P7_SPHXE|nr:caspase family protein [Sphingobium xenophagum]GBH30200.1 carboxyl-terminal processing protease [Sphingobium xenophagum]